MYVGKKKKKKPEGEDAPAPEKTKSNRLVQYRCHNGNAKDPLMGPRPREVEDPLTGLSHLHYGNNTEPADEPFDPASEQNHLGPSGQFLTSLDSSGSE